MSQYAPSPSPRPPRRNDLTFLVRPQNYQTINPATVLAPPFVAQYPSPETPLPELLRKGHHIAAANTAAALLIDPAQASVSDSARIFSLLYARFASLQLCGQTGLAARESRIFGDLSDSHVYRIEQDQDPVTSPWGQHLMPWVMRVMCVRLQAIGFGDWRRGIMQLFEMAREARWEVKRARSAKAEDQTADRQVSAQVWEERLADLGLSVADALVEVKDFEGAVVHLKSLLTGKRSSTVRTRLTLLFLRIGDVDSARRLCSDRKDSTATDLRRSQLLEAVCDTAEGKFEAAAEKYQAVANDATAEQDDGIQAVALQNMAVCKAYTGHLTEAQRSLEDLVEGEKSWSLRGLNFNLATIYELVADSERSKALKIELADTMKMHDEGDRALAEFKL
ncbi:MAG: hypothetical protein M1828_001810 [Chrysothrix sp. TS-e1954]|nr:MAG: hypothetical protein M1828_001810 [Chrysothrix sp. TS-e1954]